MPLRQLIPSAEPYYLPGGKTACLLIHGFTSSPEESRPLGEDLHRLGYSVLGLRLAGHGTHPRDLGRVRTEDWLLDLEDGISLLEGAAKQVVLVGQSLGGCLALAAAAHTPAAGVVGISTPYPSQVSAPRQAFQRISEVFHPTIKKSSPQPHPTLGVRREAGYPAYTEFPSRVLQQLFRTQQIMAQGLPEVKPPVLLLQSRDDPFLDPQGPPRILEELGSSQKELVWLDGLGHSITNHPGRGKALELIATFLESCCS